LVWERTSEQEHVVVAALFATFTLHTHSTVRRKNPSILRRLLALLVAKIDEILAKGKQTILAD